mmetsp:Transcript_16433/g.46777  ORF Transcript_16433/g.46777 Transcript_16433/m.46777 type:complete len:205 (-) Transcript_16433:499-1113(-)
MSTGGNKGRREGGRAVRTAGARWLVYMCVCVCADRHIGIYGEKASTRYGLGHTHHKPHTHHRRKREGTPTNRPTDRHIQTHIRINTPAVNLSASLTDTHTDTDRHKTTPHQSRPQSLSQRTDLILVWANITSTRWCRFPHKVHRVTRISPLVAVCRFLCPINGAPERGADLLRCGHWRLVCCLCTGSGGLVVLLLELLPVDVRR